MQTRAGARGRLLQKPLAWRQHENPTRGAGRKSLLLASATKTTLAGRQQKSSERWRASDALAQQMNV